MPRSKDKSGQIELEDGELIYSFRKQELWRLPIRDVRMIGEYTTQDGPFIDDYFFCFVVANRSWYEASYYAKNWERVWDDLKQHFSIELTMGLYNSTDFKSRVMWPPEHKDTPLFQYRYREPQTLMQKIFWVKSVESTLSEEATRALGLSESADT